LRRVFISPKRGDEAADFRANLFVVAITSDELPRHSDVGRNLHEVRRDVMTKAIL